MANTIKTLSAGDITRKALAILHNNLVFTRTIDRQYDDRFARSGAKNGGSLLIRNPNEFTVRTGQVMDTQDVTETTQTLTLATQIGVDVNFSSVELTLSLDDFAERILQPAMARLAAEVDKTIIADCYPAVWNCQTLGFGTAPVLADVLQARALLAQNLAPSSDRYIMTDALGANGMITAGHSIYSGQPAGELSRQYAKGMVGDIYGFKFYESEMTPVHTNGSRMEGVTLYVATTTTSTAFTSAVASVRITGFSVTADGHVGDIFTIAGVYAVNPETKVTSTRLAQWVITTAFTSAPSSAATPGIQPTPYFSGPRQNCYVATTSTATVNFTATGGSGPPSVGYPNSLAYHKDAFTAVFADLEMPQGVDFASRQVYDGISLRIVRQYDVVNDKFPCRIDVLFGQKAIRPAWAVRMIH